MKQPYNPSELLKVVKLVVIMVLSLQSGDALPMTSQYIPYNPSKLVEWANTCTNDNCDLCLSQPCDKLSSAMFVQSALVYAGITSLNAKDCPHLYVSLHRDEDWVYAGETATSIIDGDVVIMNGANECCVGTGYSRITCYRGHKHSLPHKPILAVYRYKFYHKYHH